MLFVAAGVFGGRKYGEKQWAAQEKEFEARSVLMVKARPAFRAATGEGETVASIGSTTLSLIGAIRDEPALAAVAQELDLVNAWGVSAEEVMRRLREQVVTSSQGNEGQVAIRATANSAEGARDLVNTAAEKGAERIAQVLEEERGRALLALDTEVGGAQEREEEARTNLTETLEKNHKVKLHLTATTNLSDLQIYMVGDPAVTEAAMNWDRWRSQVSEQEKNQAALRRHWNQDVPKPVILEPAMTPSGPSGPDKAPFVRDGSLYGLILGLVLGMGAMLLCWKFIK